MTVHSGSRVIGFATPPTTQTQRAHYRTTVGDSWLSIAHTGRMAAGPDKVKAQDFNVQLIALWLDATLAGILGVSWDGKPRRVLVAVGAHWTTLGLNGWRFYEGADGHEHPIPKTMWHRGIQWWVDAHGGHLTALRMLRRHTGEHPMLFAEAIVYAAQHGVVLTPEVKSQGFRTELGAAAVVDPCRHHDYPCWSMALLSMKYAAEKCQAIRARGGHFALIFGRFRRQARGANKVASWPVKPDIIWGPPSARRWIR